MSIKQITKLRYKTKDKPPMEGVPLLGYNKRYKFTTMECDVEYKTSPPDEYEYVYP